MHRFSAFISYSHLDAAFARKLHRRLEAYRLPRRLTSDRVDARRHLRPIFRDHDELAAAPDLSSAVKEALADSEYLIVICSAHAEASAWVAREVSVFRELHGEHAVLAVLVDGCDDACFRRLLCSSGLDGRSIEPVGADFRRDGDGKSLAFLKLLSVLADVRLAALVQRDAQRRIRRILMATASGLASVVALASLMVIDINNHYKIIAVQEKIKHQKEIAAALIKSQNDEIRKKCIELGQTDLCTRLDQSMKAYFSTEDVADFSPPDLEEYAELLRAIGRDDEKIGEPIDAMKQFSDADNFTRKLLELEPADTERIYAHGQSEYYLAENAERLGQYRVTERGYYAYAKLADQLVQADPHNPKWLMEQSYAKGNLGIFFLRLKFDLGHAEASFLAALAAVRAVVAIKPASDEDQREIAEFYGWLGDVKRFEHDCSASATYRYQQQQIFSDLTKRSPYNADLKYALAANELALARIDLCQGAPQRALKRLADGHQVIATLADNDRINQELKKEKRIFELFEVAAWLTPPVAGHDPSGVIADTLGDCAVERKKQNNQEIAKYCFILQARWSMLRGRADDAKASLNSAEAIGSFYYGALSPGWGLNFQQEVAVTLDAQIGGDKLR